MLKDEMYLNRIQMYIYACKKPLEKVQSSRFMEMKVQIYD